LSGHVTDTIAMEYEAALHVRVAEKRKRTVDELRRLLGLFPADKIFVFVLRRAVD